MSGISGRKQGDVLGATVVLGLVGGSVAIWGHVTLKAFLIFSLALVALYWFLVIVTVPWGLYYKARVVQHEIEVSRSHGIEVPESRTTEVRHLARRLLWAAIGGHVVSAVVVAVVAHATGHVVGYYFAAFYLLSTAFRPAAAYFVYLKARITSLLRETKFPRDDVLAMQRELETLRAAVEANHEFAVLSSERTSLELDGVRNDLRDGAARHREDLRLARESFTTDHSSIQARLNSVEGRMSSMTRHFDEAVDGVSDQQDLIAGIRAFVRMAKDTPVR